MIVKSTVYSGVNKRKHQSSALLAFLRGIHRWPVNSSHKGPVTRKMFPLDDVIMGKYTPETRACNRIVKLCTTFKALLCSRIFDKHIIISLEYLFPNQTSLHPFMKIHVCHLLLTYVQIRLEIRFMAMIYVIKTENQIQLVISNR